MFTKKDRYHMLQHYRIRTPKSRFDDNGALIVGSGFHLDRPDARVVIERLGLAYEAVRLGLQALDDAKIDELFEADVQMAIEYACTHITDFQTLMPLHQMAVVDLILDRGPTHFEAFMRTITTANAEEWAVGDLPANADSWYDAEK